MIFESAYWKQPLLTSAKRLRRFMTLETLTERQFAQFERDVFIGFYSVRKLLEAFGKVSESSRKMRLPIHWHPKRPEAPEADWRNRNDLLELYDVEVCHAEQRDVLYVAHRMVHSFIFIPARQEGSDVDGIYFTSDNDKDRRISFIQTERIAATFETFGKDYPETFRVWKDPATGKWECSA